MTPALGPLYAEPSSVDEPTPVEKPGRFRIRRNESGLALVWMSMFLMVLVGFAALAIDIGHGYLVAQRAQNAADAAALAGTVYLPADPTTAYSTVQSVAAANGFPASVATVSAMQETVKTQLRVTITDDVETWFGKAIGWNSMRVRRTAVADYDQPVAMGSPANTFGNQPDCTAPCTTASDSTPEFWANIEGPDTAKVQGNAFSTRWCSNTAADNCVENTFGNSDYDANGFYYVIRNNASGGPLKIDVFDAPFVDVGSNCDDSSLKSLYNSLPSSTKPRYAPGGWSATTGQYCTGDQNGFGDNAGNSQAPMNMRFTLYKPDSTSWDYSDNVPVPGCDITVSGYADAQAAYNDATNGRPKFRNWWNECSVASPSTGDYILQVRTTAGTGANGFSLRAYKGTPQSGSGISIFGSGKMGIQVNSPNSNSTDFYLARVFPGAAGRTMKLDFFDIGDAGGSGSIKVLPPADATVNGSGISQFSNCKYAAPPQNPSGPPWGTYTSTASDCSVSGITSTNYNGQWVEFLVPIPNGYTCDATDPFKCWIKIHFSFSSGVHDVSSWTASLDGNPVRLIK